MGAGLAGYQKAVKTKPLETGRMHFCSVVIVGFVCFGLFFNPLVPIKNIWKRPKLNEAVTSTPTPKTETLSPGGFVRHGAFSFISAVCVAHVKGLVYISAVVSCLRRWNSSCFADRDKHDKKSSCRTHLEARDSGGRSCAPSPAPLLGMPAGLWGEGWGHPARRERGAAPLVSGFIVCARSE